MGRLDFEPRLEIDRVGRFLSDELKRAPRRQGLVVGLSGGVDSAVTAALACRALGPDRVVGVLLPERESHSDSLALGQQLAAELGIETVLEDLTQVLDVLGVYRRRERIVRDFSPGFSDGWRYCLRLPGDMRERREFNVYRLEVHPPDGEVEKYRLPLEAYRKIQAATNVKQRLRMVRLFEQAEARGYLVAGTTNRSEMLQGFFVRYGDGGVDLEPIAHLYKTQIYTLGRYLNVPIGTLERPPSPDAYSAAVDDSDFFFRLPYDVLDPVLACFEAGEPVEVAAREAGLEIEDAKRAYKEVDRREQASRRTRELAPSLPFEGGVTNGR